MPYNSKEKYKANLAKRRRAAREYVKARRQSTVCETCGAQPVDWHSEGHAEKPHMRIASMAARGDSVERIAREIENCHALCRRCHMRRAELARKNFGHETQATA